MRGAAVLYVTATETLAIAIAGVVAQIFRSFLSAPLLGVSMGFFCARLVVKFIDHYNPELSIQISKQVCTQIKYGSQQRMISLLLVSALSLISGTYGFNLGTGLGVLNAIVLDIENCKYIQDIHRQRLQRNITCPF